MTGRESLLPLREQRWIASRGKRWVVLVLLKHGEISLIEAEKRLREIDGTGE